MICSKRDRRSSIRAGGIYLPSLGYLFLAGQVLSHLSPPAGRTSDLSRPCSLLLRPDVLPAPVHHASQARERLVLAARNAERSGRSMTMRALIERALPRPNLPSVKDRTPSSAYRTAQVVQQYRLRRLGQELRGHCGQLANAARRGGDAECRSRRCRETKNRSRTSFKFSPISASRQDVFCGHAPQPCPHR